jgi:hydroxyacylglutathione hydrolase
MIMYDDSDENTCFLQLHLGGDRNFCYLVGDLKSKEGQFAAAAEDRGLKIRMILLTHGHSDHADRAGELARITGAPMYAGKPEKVPNAMPLTDGQRLVLGECPILVYHTPGHTPGHLCYLFKKRLITGDLLFCGKVGGTGRQFPGSSPKKEWDSLQRIMGLPEDVRVFPGHDYYGGQGNMQHSTIGYEKQHNPFLLCESYEAFCHLKDTWDSYKAEHGIR